MTNRWRAEPPLSHHREAQPSPGSSPESLPMDSSATHITQGLAGMVTATSGRCKDKSPSLLLSRSHKECWFTFGEAEGLFISPSLCWAIKNIYSRNNMSSPPQMSLHYSPCFFKQYSYPEKLTSTTQANLQTTQHRLCHYAECNVLDLG